MVSFRNLALVASTIFGLSSAAPTEILDKRARVSNNTQEFYILMTVTDGNPKYTQWARTSPPSFSHTPSNKPKVQASHTGAGFADPIFVQNKTDATPAFLNGTHLQFDVNVPGYPFSANGFPSDTNYARWEAIDITSGYGTGVWKNEGPDGLVVDNEEFDGWLVCEWFHGTDAPQLFQLIAGFDGGESGAYTFPSSCARVLLFPEFI
jgi:hypothetical protein